ncbi:unnamed protein product [Protopolystoma xenopodis]|uniref:protein xylosyltransferase n=1 Tax=Protopolystoma xenopodis TaxID=117903 RepID=A0A3S5B901_9PLAT|nr:unnamed protein product [Protopolystoma xenopodis]
MDSDCSQFLRGQAIDQAFYECDAHLFRLGNRPLPRGLVLASGSDWYLLPRDFLLYAVFGRDGLVDRLRDFYRYSVLPVESFYHVLAMNSHFCQRLVNSNLHLVNWRRPQGCWCKEALPVDWCGCSPAVFTGPHDLARLLRLHSSSPYYANTMDLNSSSALSHTSNLNNLFFFARKFDSTVDLALLNLAIVRLMKDDRLNDENWSLYLEPVYLDFWDRSGDIGLRTALLALALTGLDHSTRNLPSSHCLTTAAQAGRSILLHFV